MMISTRGRYALRVMIDLAEQAAGGYIPMKDIVERQGLSLKYLERILPVLAKTALWKACRARAAVTACAASPGNTPWEKSFA